MKTNNTMNNESTIRRRAKKLGLTLQKSRSRNKQWPGYGTYRLLDASRNLVIYGGNHDTFGATLEDCANYVQSRSTEITQSK